MKPVYMLSSEKLDQLFGLRTINDDLNLDLDTPWNKHYSAQQSEIVRTILDSEGPTARLDFSEVFVIDSILDSGLFRIIDVTFKNLSPRDVSPHSKNNLGNYQLELMKYIKGEYYHQTGTRVVVASQRISHAFKHDYDRIMLHTLVKKILS